MEYLKRSSEWESNQKLNLELKKELENLTGPEIQEAFYTELQFGTGGLRGLMGVGTNRINIHVINKATKGFANYLVSKYKKNISVAISYDNRKNSRIFAYEAAKVLAANNIKTYIFPDLRPTPMLSYAVRYFHSQGGIMVTASHNPKEYNGYKVYDDTGAQLNLEDSKKVIEEIRKVDNYFDIESIDDSKLICEIGMELETSYLDLVEKIKFNKTDKKTKIVYSPLHGTGGTVIVNLLKKHGYNVLPYEPQMINDPNFGATKSSNPEEAITYEPLITFAKQSNAKAILVTDPDADRLGVAVLHDNEFVLLNGNQTAALELSYILDNTKKLPKDGYVFTTIVTSDLIVELAKSHGLNVVATLTGFKFIGEQAKLIEGKHPYVFGCEESYGSLVKDFVRDKDAVQAVYLLAEMINYFDEKNITLVDYLNEIFHKYGTYHEVTNQVSLKGIEGSLKIQRIMDFYRANPLIIDEYNLQYFDDLEASTRYTIDKKIPINLPSSNVLKFYYNDNLWVTLRPSGTEPKIKIYYGVKTTSIEKAIEIIAKIDAKIMAQIDGI